MQVTKATVRALGVLSRRGSCRPIELARGLWPKGNPLALARNAGAQLVHLERNGLARAVTVCGVKTYTLTKLGLEVLAKGQAALAKARR